MMQRVANYDQLLAAAPRVAALPRDKRNLPIPFVVLRDDASKPDFIVNDITRVLSCLTFGWCSICGQKMDDTDVWFLGGVKSGLHPAGMYNDSPVHHECGTFALQVCPYLAIGRHTGMKPIARHSVLQKLIDEGRAAGFVDPTVDPNKPDTYIMGRATGMVVVQTGGDSGQKLIPNRPFAEIEEWKDGEKVGGAGPGDEDAHGAFRSRGYQMAKDTGHNALNLPPLLVSLWDNGYEGKFPWKKG